MLAQWDVGMSLLATTCLSFCKGGLKSWMVLISMDQAREAWMHVIQIGSTPDHTHMAPHTAPQQMTRFGTCNIIGDYATLSGKAFPKNSMFLLR